MVVAVYRQPRAKRREHRVPLYDKFLNNKEIISIKNYRGKIAYTSKKDTRWLKILHYAESVKSLYVEYLTVWRDSTTNTYGIYTYIYTT